MWPWASLAHPWVEVMVQGGSTAMPAISALVLQLSCTVHPWGLSDFLCDLSDMVLSSRESGEEGCLGKTSAGRGTEKELNVLWIFACVFEVVYSEHLDQWINTFNSLKYKNKKKLMRMIGEKVTKIDKKKKRRKSYTPACNLFIPVRLQVWERNVC